VRKADNLPPSCAIVTKYGNLNFLEPSGPVQACNGTGLLYFTMSELATYSSTYSECQVIFDGLSDLGLYFMLPIAKSLCSHCSSFCFGGASLSNLCWKISCIWFISFLF